MFGGKYLVDERVCAVGVGRAVLRLWAVHETKVLQQQQGAFVVQSVQCLVSKKNEPCILA